MASGGPEFGAGCADVWLDAGRLRERPAPEADAPKDLVRHVDVGDVARQRRLARVGRDAVGAAEVGRPVRDLTVVVVEMGIAVGEVEVAGRDAERVVRGDQEPAAAVVSRVPGMLTENIGSPKTLAVRRAFSCMPLISGVAGKVGELGLDEGLADRDRTSADP